MQPHWVVFLVSLGPTAAYFGYNRIMPDPSDQLPRRITTAFHKAGLQPYRTNTTTGIRAFFRSIDDARRAAEILRRMGYRVDVLIRPKLRAGGQSHFFTSAAQLTITVSGAFGSVCTTALIRNRCPSAVTA
jgi:hypothetical protein